MLTAILEDVSDLYLRQRELIDRAVTSVCRRHHLSSADADDFRSATHLHVIDHDYAVLRAYQGRAEIGAFLQAVVRRQFQDWRNANWGRWRPSVAARRDGPVAILLETLIVRDRRPMHEACEVLRTNHGVTASDAELEAMAARFPNRVGRSLTSLDDVGEPADESSAEFSSASATVDRRELASSAERVGAQLDRVLASLPPQDQLILRMRFESGAPISTISRVLGLPQPPLYRRVDRLLASVRSALEQAGVDADEARDVIYRRGFDLLERRPT
jgi:RNA polymerase sigma factor for flagellar operon FliA